MLIAVLSDTHAPRFWKQCPIPVARQLENVDLILHAGDVCRADVLDELQQFAPVKAVKGNNDGDDVEAWGSPTDKRRQPHKTMGLLTIADGRLERLQLVTVD
jgi:putative phosphoesterase